MQRMKYSFEVEDNNVFYFPIGIIVLSIFMQLKKLYIMIEEIPVFEGL